MSAERLQLIGGPLDGHEIPKPKGRYVWVAGQTAYDEQDTPLGPLLTFRRGRSGTSTPTSGRALYFVSARDYGVYAGHTTTYCNGCGCYHDKREGGRERQPCPLDGATRHEHGRR